MKFPILFFSLILLVSSNLIGQSNINSSGNWSDPGIWDGGDIGDSGETVTMDRSLNVTIQNGETFSIASLTVDRSGSLTIDAGGELIITGNYNSARSFTINVSDTLTIQSDLVVDRSLNINVLGAGVLEVMNISGARDTDITVIGSLTVNGDLDLGDNSNLDVTGTVDITGDLNLGAGSTITGVGPVSTGPVELLSFNAQVKGDNVEIVWATLTEQDNDFFTIERSADGINFHPIAKIPGFGTTSLRQNYQYTDETPLIGVSFYRLKQTDFDGQFEIFDAEFVQYTDIEQITIFPNAVNKGNEVRIITGAFSQEKLMFTIYNLEGKIVSQASNIGDFTNIHINANMDSGIYILNVSSGKVSRNARLLVR